MATEPEEVSEKINAPKFEIALILIFFACFIMWSVSRCNAKRSEMRQAEIIENGEDLRPKPTVQSGVMRDATPEVEGATTEATPTAQAPQKPTPPPSKPKPTPKPSAPVGTPLYITIDNLNMRDHPHLDSTVVARLPLFELVTFMDEVTDFKQEINLGKVMANEPWVKIQTKKGKIGWVYGAGVHYYKIKREGVQ
ncbi:MAG: SH3 domain-containing protein [Bacteroidota bacterium]